MKDVIFKLNILHLFLSDAYEGWKNTVWGKDLDANYCCDGNMCACGGMSLREVYEGCYGTESEPKQQTEKG